jgi:hypothetical protein
VSRSGRGGGGEEQAAGLQRWTTIAWKAARDGAVAASAGRRFHSGMVRGARGRRQFCITVFCWRVILQWVGFPGLVTEAADGGERAGVDAG